jgi:enoyl-CoA hydratase/carnithine racemase
LGNFIIREKLSEYIVILRLNRPETFNACSYELLEILEKNLDELLNEKDLRTLIITGTDKSFSSGGDLKQLKDFGPEDARKWCDFGHRLMSKIEYFPVPVIAAINGYCLGGGAEIAIACDLRYASESAKLGSPESKVGMITGWGGTFRLPRLIGVARAKELAYTGKLITAIEAKEIGLVNDVYSNEQFKDKVNEIAEQIAKMAPHSNRLSKKMLNRYPFDLNVIKNEESLALAYCVTTEDKTEAINAFLEKRDPVFKNK